MDEEKNNIFPFLDVLAKKKDSSSFISSVYRPIHELGFIYPGI